METIICAVISAVSAVVVAVVSAFSVRSNKRMEKAQAEATIRADRRREESLLSLELMSATMELSVACCNALCGGKNNGNVEVAKQKAQKAHDRYIAFERRVLTEELN